MQSGPLSHGRPLLQPCVPTHTLSPAGRMACCQNNVFRHQIVTSFVLTELPGLELRHFVIRGLSMNPPRVSSLMLCPPDISG